MRLASGLAALLLGALSVSAAPTRYTHHKRQPPTTSIDGIKCQTYDYVIVGGGLTGSVLASRLSDASSVLLIEAGHEEEDNPLVTDASNYQKGFDTPIDWAYHTTPQTSANGQTQVLRSGKALGGSTVINGMAWSKPHTFQLDALEAVGNDGVNWASLQSYMLRAENFHPPAEWQGVTYDANCRGTGGPIGTGINGSPNDFERDFTAAATGMGMPFVDDLTCGNPAGLGPMSHNNVDNIRSDAYRGYIYGQAKPSLTILTGATVTKVNLLPDTLRADGVEGRAEDGTAFVVSARNDVILAAGALRTPVILQHSGIGPSNVLAAAGVAQRHELPVGLNLIDQVATTTNFDTTGPGGGGQPITWPRFQDLFQGDDAARVRGMLETKIAQYAQESVDAGAAESAAGLERVLQIQADWILNQGAGMSENYDYTYDTTLGYDSWFLLPFGRGSVKITGSGADDYAIDPRFFANEFDALASAATARFTRTLSSTAPLSGRITAERETAGLDGSLDAWAGWSKDHYRSNWHAIGTVPMMSRDLGGCVDARHRVYGVEGLRVVDGSNLPFQVSSHLMSVLFGVAERAAEVIAEDHRQ